MTILDLVYAKGHPNVLCTHDTTLEITKDKNLTPNGNCIIGIEASKACSDLNKNLLNYIKKGNKIEVFIKYEDMVDNFFGFGHKDLTLDSKNDMVFRKSNYICDRTVLINCSKSSIELSRDLVNKIKHTTDKFLIIFKKVEFNE